MKTVLHTIDTTGPGGAETVFIDLITRLPQDKFRSVVVIRGKGWVHDELVRRGVSPILLNSKGSFNLLYLWRLRSIIIREKVDLIQSHLLGTSVYGSLLGILTSKPVISTFHGSVDIGENERFKWLKFFIINKGASRIVAVTDSLLADILSRTSLQNRKACVIYNGIDTAAYLRPSSNSFRLENGWDKDEIIIGCLGNVRPAKGYDVLLEAAALLVQRGVEFRILIAGQGKGELYDNLLTLRKRLALEDKVLFLGFIDDAADFLANVDIFLSSSISEGLPLSAIQAMVSGLPMVVTRCGGYVELITNEKTGLHVDVGSPGAIADGIEKVVQDPGLKTNLSENAKDFAIETFDIKVMIESYVELYDKFLIR